jgi:DNA replication and repair protein RecF
VFALRVKDVRLINFRNYDSLSLELNPNMNLFIGKNAQGKTNLLESIYISAMGRSFRTNRDLELIEFNKEQAYVGVNIDINGLNRFIEVKLDKDRPKRIRINKNELKNYKELYSGLNVVTFYPEDLRLVKDGPSERRRFLDLEISQIRPVYNYNLSKYNKILFQRNNVLKSRKFSSNIEEILEIFDLQIAKIGTEIIKERMKYIEELSRISDDIHRQIVLRDESLTIDYMTNIPVLASKKEMEKLYIKTLKDNIKRDVETNTTTYGPHRDDMKILLDGKDMKIYGSQGQQRTIVLSMKLSEIEIIKNERGSYPVLLLDDVFSELDINRRRYLLNSLKEIQTIITATDSIDLEELKEIEKTMFYVEQGQLKKILNP